MFALCYTEDGDERDFIDMARIKSVWRGTPSRIWKFICPTCHTERRVPLRGAPGGIHYVQIGLTAALFTVAAWPIFGIKGFVSFLPIWAVFETVYRIRRRGIVMCPKCGFDPVLFMRDSDRARDEMRKFWVKRFEEKGIEIPKQP